MSGLAWAVFALASAFLRSGSALIGEFSRVSSLHLMFWMRVVGFLLLLPVVFLVEWPGNPYYYLCVIATGFIFAFYDVLVFSLTARHGAGVVTRLEPLMVWGVFFLWVLVTPSLLLDYIQNPVRGGGVLLSILACVYFSLRLKKCTISMDALKILWPYILMASVGLVLSKTAMNLSPFHSGILFYGFIQCAIALPIYVLLVSRNKFNLVGGEDFENRVTGRRTVFFGVMTGLIWTIANIVKYYGITLAENPAYITVFGLTSPLWVLLVYKGIGRKEKAEIWPGLGIVASAAALIICTRF